MYTGLYISNEIVKTCRKYLASVDGRIVNIGRHDVQGKKDLCVNLIRFAEDYATFERRRQYVHLEGTREEQRVLQALDRALNWLATSNHCQTELRSRLQSISRGPEIGNEIVSVCSAYLSKIDSRISDLGRHDMQGKKNLCVNLMRVAENYLVFERDRQYVGGTQEEREMLQELDNALGWLATSDHWETGLRAQLHLISDQASQPVITPKASKRNGLRP